MVAGAVPLKIFVIFDQSHADNLTAHASSALVIFMTADKHPALRAMPKMLVTATLACSRDLLVAFDLVRLEQR